MKESKSPLCHLLSMAVLGFIVLFSIAEMASKDGATYVKDIFGNTELVFPKYICIFAASYFLGVIMHALGHLAFGWLSRGCGLMIKCVRKRFYKKIRTSTPQCPPKNANSAGKTIDSNCKEYYKEYYKVLLNDNCSIPIMEGIVSFLSSMVIVIIIVWGVAMCKCNMSTACKIISITIPEILVFLAMCLTQCKIYYMVIRESYSSESDGKHTEEQDEGDN